MTMLLYTRRRCLALSYECSFIVKTVQQPPGSTARYFCNKPCQILKTSKQDEMMKTKKSRSNENQVESHIEASDYELDLSPSKRAATRVTQPMANLHDSDNRDISRWRSHRCNRGNSRFSDSRLHADNHGYSRPYRDNRDNTKFSNNARRDDRAIENFRGSKFSNGSRMGWKNSQILEDGVPNRANRASHQPNEAHNRDEALNRALYNYNDRALNQVLYNHGLPGVGKNVSHKNQHPFPSPTYHDILFGLHPVLLSLENSRRRASKLYVRKKQLKNPTNDMISRILHAAEAREVPVVEAGRKALSQLSQDRPNQGVCIETSRLSYVEMDMSDEEEPSLSRRVCKEERSQNQRVCEEEPSQNRSVWLVLDSVQDPMNLGAVIRSAYYLGVDRLIVTSNNSCPLSPVVSKASAGCMEIWPVYSIKDIAHFLQAKSSSGWNIVGAVGLRAENASPVQSLTTEKDTILVMGNEGAGLAAEVLNACHQCVTLPPGRPDIHDNLDSLNVSVATGILLHHLLKS